jgi:hypothetical protein
MRTARFSAGMWVLFLTIFLAPNVMAGEAPSMGAEAYVDLGMMNRGAFQRSIEAQPSGRQK